jgi:hypothetical protein
MNQKTKFILQESETDWSVYTEMTRVMVGRVTKKEPDVFVPAAFVRFHIDQLDAISRLLVENHTAQIRLRTS